MVQRLDAPFRALLTICFGVAGIAGFVRPVLESRAHGDAFVPPSQALLVRLSGDGFVAACLGLIAFIALAGPWLLRGGRPAPRNGIAAHWARFLAAAAWVVVGLQYNRTVIGSWRTVSETTSLPVALTDPSILGRNLAITVGAILLAWILSFVLRQTLPRSEFPRPAGIVTVLALVPVALGLAAPTLRTALRPTPNGPDLILISLDAARADRLGAYGGRDGLTPALDALAARGVVFERAYAQEPWTLTSHMSMLTGLLPDAHRVGPRRPIAPSRRLVAEALREAGYRTAASVMACHWLSPDFGYATGFDLYEEDIRPAGPRAAAAAQWLLEDERPGFLFLHLYDPHSDWGTLPYESTDEARARFAPGAARGFADWTPPEGASDALRQVNEGTLSMPDSLRRATAALYDAGLHDTDAALGRFFEALDAAGRLENALVLVIADHGEALGERGLFLHGEMMEATLRIPLILKLPRDIRSGTRVERMVETVDVAPTLLAAAGLDPFDPVQGRSLLDGKERAFVSHRRGRLRAITTDDGWRLEYEHTDDAIVPAALRRVVDVSTEGPNLLPDSLQVFDRWIEPIQALHRANRAIARPYDAATVTPSEADLELLRALGYIE